MTFALSGSIITQSGTNTSLDGLENIAGVSMTKTGDVYKTYNVGNLKLSIEGTLTISPEKEIVLSSSKDSLIVKNGGTLNIDGKITKNSVTSYSANYWLISSNTETGYLLDVQNGATLDWQGGYIKGKKNVRGQYNSDTNRSKATLKNGGINFMQFFSTYPGMVRFFTNDLTVDGFKFIDGGSWVPFRPSINTVKNLVFDHAYGIGWSGASQDNVFHIIRDYESFNAQQDAGFWSDVWSRFINSEKGSDLKIMGYSTNSSYNKGLVEIVKEINVSVKDEDGTALENALVHLHDTNNNNRADFGVNNYTNDRPYNFLTNATGKTGIQQILTAVAVRKTGGAKGTNNAGDNEKDYRSKNNNSDDIFDIRIWAYGYQPELLTKSLKGKGVLEIELLLHEDHYITEQNIDIVKAYPGLSMDHNSKTITISEDTTTEQAYDYFSYEKLEHGTSNEEPEHDLMHPHDTTIDIDDYNVVISPGKKLSATKKLDTIETTGTVTGNTNCIIKDANVDSYLIFEGVDSWKVYSSSADRFNETGELGSGTGNDIYHFQYNQGGKYYIAILVGDDTIQKDVTPAAKGKTVVAQSLYSLINAIRINSVGAFSEIKNIHSSIQKNIEFTSGEIRKSMSHTQIDFVPNDDNSSKFTVSDVTRNDDILEFGTGQNTATIDITADPTEEYDITTFSLKSMQYYGGRLEIAKYVVNGAGTETYVTYNYSGHGGMVEDAVLPLSSDLEYIEAEKNKGKPDDQKVELTTNIAKFRYKITKEDSAPMKFKMGKFHAGVYKLKKNDELRVSVVSVGDDAVSGISDVKNTDAELKAALADTNGKIDATKSKVDSIDTKVSGNLDAKISDFIPKLAKMESDVKILRQLKENKWKIDMTSDTEQTLTVYDDDKTTVLKQWKVTIDTSNNVKEITPQ